ncbi:MAG: GspMb/PilO family protein [Syntrophothermus sp.]
MAISKRERILLITAGALLVVTLIYRGILGGDPGKLGGIRTEYAQVQKQLQQASFLLHNRSLYEARIKQMKTSLDDGQAGAPMPKEPGRALVWFLGDLEGLAKQAGLRVNAKTPVEVQPVKGYTAIGVELNTDATGEALTNFLYLLETRRPAYDVGRLIVQPREGNPLLAANLLVTTLMSEKGDEPRKDDQR